MQPSEHIPHVVARARRLTQSWRIASRLSFVLVVAAVCVVDADLAKGQGRDPAVQALRDAVAAGEMSEEEAREVYFASVYPGSETEAKIAARFDDTVAKINAMTESGDLSAEDAAAKIEAMGAQLVRDAEVAFAVEVRGLSLAQANRESVAAQIEEAVLSGAITDAQAAEKMIAIDQEAAMKAEAAAYTDAVGQELKALVQAGELTEEEAKARFADAKRQFDVQVKADLYLQQVEAKLSAQVAAGKMSSQEAEAYLEQLRAGLLGQNAIVKAEKPVDPWVKLTEAFIEKHELGKEAAKKARKLCEQTVELRKRIEKQVDDANNKANTIDPVLLTKRLEELEAEIEKLKQTRLLAGLERLRDAGGR